MQLIDSYARPLSAPRMTASLLVAFSSFTSIASADITQNVSGGGYATVFPSGCGESFTAVDANIGLAGFMLIDVNPGAGNIAYNILKGDGLDGSVVASRSSSGPPINVGFKGFFDLDFSGTTLSVGQQYTLEMVTSSPRWAAFYSTFDVYSGTSYNAGTFYSDFTFHILAVPEPSTLTLLALGAIGAFSIRRRIR